jgi:flotillin
MGLQIVSFTIKEINDSVGYLEALGKPRIAEVQRDATIAQAEATRDATIKSAEPGGQERRPFKPKVGIWPAVTSK